MNNKNINELTEKEAKEILQFVYPNNKNFCFMDIALEPKINKDGSQQVTFNIRPIVGIKYHNGEDNCILHFDNTKVVLWLYMNNYDILKYLKENSYYSEMEKDFEDFAYAIKTMSKGEDAFNENYKHNWTLELVKTTCKELVDKYYYKDYD